MSCGPERVEIVKPPAELESCADAPDTPVYPDYDWSSVETVKPIVQARDLMTREWVAAWRTAFASCKAIPVGVKAWSDTLE